MAAGPGWRPPVVGGMSPGTGAGLPPRKPRPQVSEENPMNYLRCVCAGLTLAAVGLSAGCSCHSHCRSGCPAPVASSAPPCCGGAAPVMTGAPAPTPAYAPPPAPYGGH